MCDSSDGWSPRCCVLNFSLAVSPYVKCHSSDNRVRSDRADWRMKRWSLVPRKSFATGYEAEGKYFLIFIAIPFSDSVLIRSTNNRVDESNWICFSMFIICFKISWINTVSVRNSLCLIGSSHMIISARRKIAEPFLSVENRRYRLTVESF